MVTSITPPKRLHKLAIYHEGKLLILKRAKVNAYYPEFWGLPTVLSDDETNNPEIDRLIKEAKVQYDLTIENVELAGDFPIILPDGYDETIRIYSCQTNDSTVKIDAKHTEYRWVTLAELTQYPILPSMEQFLRPTT